MKRRAFLLLTTGPFLALRCTYRNGQDELKGVLLELDLTKDLRSVGDSIITPQGLFVKRIGAGQTLQDFLCLWTICTHARCFVNYRSQAAEFVCPCHGSIFNSNGHPVQGPAATPLLQQSFTIDGTRLRVHG